VGGFVVLFVAFDVVLVGAASVVETKSDMARKAKRRRGMRREVKERERGVQEVFERDMFASSIGPRLIVRIVGIEVVVCLLRGIDVPL
jgi:hypothetical protein